MKTPHFQTARSIDPVSKVNRRRRLTACQSTKPICWLLDLFVVLFEEVKWVTGLILPVPARTLYVLLSQVIKQNVIVGGCFCEALHIPRWEEEEGLGERIQSIRRKTS